MQSLMGVSDVAVLPHVLAHYRLTAPLIDESLAGTPIVYRNYPNGIDKTGVFHITDVPLSPDKLLWLIHAKYAIEFYTWAPDAHDEDRLRFGRVLLEPPSGVAFERVKLAALALRALLFETQKFEAVPLLDGGRGVALWIPFADSPHALELRRWLNEFRRIAPRPCTPTSFRPSSIRTPTAASTFMYRATPRVITARYRIVCARKV